MGFFRDRIAADDCATRYVGNLRYPGVTDMKLLQQSQKALKKTCEVGFLQGVAIGRSPETMTPPEKVAEAWAEALQLPEDPGLTAERRDAARTALRRAYEHGCRAGQAYGRTHP